MFTGVRHAVIQMNRMVNTRTLLNLFIGGNNDYTPLPLLKKVSRLN
jgi:hypothetical protein